MQKLSNGSYKYGMVITFWWWYWPLAHKVKLIWQTWPKWDPGDDAGNICHCHGFFRLAVALVFALRSLIFDRKSLRIFESGWKFGKSLVFSLVPPRKGKSFVGLGTFDTMGKIVKIGDFLERRTPHLSNWAFTFKKVKCTHYFERTFLELTL